MVAQRRTVSPFATRNKPVMIAHVWAEIHPDVIDARRITFVCIEEDKIPYFERREVFDLNTSIRDNNYSGRGFTYLKGAAWYRAL